MSQQACPFWTTWTEWTKCTASCGGGTTTRVRACNNGQIGDVGCVGDSVEQATCGTASCSK